MQENVPEVYGEHYKPKIEETDRKSARKGGWGKALYSVYLFLYFPSQRNEICGSRTSAIFRPREIPNRYLPILANGAG
jgi:hypothetical protein